MIRKHYLKFLFLGMMFCAGFVQAGEPVVVIVNSSNTQTLSPRVIKDIYSDRKTHWASGKKIAVYNLPPSAVAREVFDRKILGISAEDAAARESNRRIMNTSRNPQKTKRARLVVSIVSKNPSAIGYVPEATAMGRTGVRVLMRLQ